ncbi:MAG: hypothetical protein JWN59_562 [Sphingomonas bacterium]|nr:hypothetical protein [Sphingomonas bacterium]
MALALRDQRTVRGIEAIDGARALMADQVMLGCPIDLNNRMEVTDQSGEVLAVIPFRELIKIKDNGLTPDVLPFSPPGKTIVRGCHGAHRGGCAQPAWQHRRASARLSRYAVARGCSRLARAAAPSGRDRATRTASR